MSNDCGEGCSEPEFVPNRSNTSSRKTLPPRFQKSSPKKKQSPTGSVGGPTTHTESAKTDDVLKPVSNSQIKKVKHPDIQRYVPRAQRKREDVAVLKKTSEVAKPATDSFKHSSNDLPVTDVNKPKHGHGLKKQTNSSSVVKTGPEQKSSASAPSERSCDIKQKSTKKSPPSSAKSGKETIRSKPATTDVYEGRITGLVFERNTSNDAMSSGYPVNRKTGASKSKYSDGVRRPQSQRSKPAQRAHSRKPVESSADTDKQLQLQTHNGRSSIGHPKTMDDDTLTTIPLEYREKPHLKSIDSALESENADKSTGGILRLPINVTIPRVLPPEEQSEAGLVDVPYGELVVEAVNPSLSKKKWSHTQPQGTWSSNQDNDDFGYKVRASAHPNMGRAPLLSPNSRAGVPGHIRPISSESNDRPSAPVSIPMQRLLVQIDPLDEQLNLLSSQMTPDMVPRIMSLRLHLSQLYHDAILIDLECAHNRQLDQQMWKTVYHSVIEGLKVCLESANNPMVIQGLQENLNTLFTEGRHFYETLIRTLEAKHQFSIQNIEDISHIQRMSRSAKLALITVQRCLTALGDLARYNTQLSNGSNYGLARSLYLKAQQIAPKNGLPYSRLAVLAMYTKHIVDAVYYYMRSLASTNPFLSAHESLVTLFNEARKKAESEKRLRESGLRRSRQNEEVLRRRRGESDDSNRKEIWIHPEGGNNDDRTQNTTKSESTTSSNITDPFCLELRELPETEISKRFVVTFLYAHGKLYSKLALETMAEAESHLLHHFTALLNISPLPFSTELLLQYCAVSLFQVYHCGGNLYNQSGLASPVLDNTSSAVLYRPVVQEHAVQLTLDMFAIIVERFTRLFSITTGSRSEPTLDCPLNLVPDQIILLPSLKLFADWLMAQSMKYWNPAPNLRDPELGPNLDVWASVATLVNSIQKHLENLGPVVVLHDSAQAAGSESKRVLLEEDAMMAGFVPLLSVSPEPVYVASTTDMSAAKNWLRLSRLLLVADFLVGIESPVLCWSGGHYCAAQSTVSVSEKSTKRERGQDSSMESPIPDDQQDRLSLDSDSDSDMTDLRRRHRHLKIQCEKQQQHSSGVQAVLQSELHSQGRQIQIEIRPCQLVIDTNCFISYMHFVERLLKCRKFVLIVPLIVISELDGLAKNIGNTVPDSSKSERAAMAVRFLESAFDSHDPNLRAITAEGNIMDTIAFRSEALAPASVNDDIILSCCQHFCKDIARDFMPKDPDDPIRLHREVVLLTEDRNLHLKAYSHNVPVRGIAAFCRWARLPPLR